MTVVEVWRRLGGPLSNMLGATLILVGVALAAVNAHDVQHHEETAAAHGGQVIDLDEAAQPQPGMQGHMVRLVATPRVLEAPRDAQFNLSADTSLLTRHVEMFQWREVRVGEGVHYELDWVDHWIDSNAFRLPRGHANPARAPLQGRQFAAGVVQVAGYRLAPTLQRALPGSSIVPPPTLSLPANLAASFSRHGDYLQTSTQPDNPQLGDIRVSWSAVPRSQVTVVARVEGNTLVPAVDAADGQGFQLVIGNASLLALFPDLPSPPTGVALKRVAAVLLAALGAFVLLSVRRRLPEKEGFPRHRVVDDAWLALGAGALVVGAFTGVVWVGHDNQRLAYWLVATVLAAVLVAWQIRRRCRH
ncbi:MAG: TMEM43 family protein [Rhodanobacter sp.]